MTRYMPQETGAWPHVPAGDYEGEFSEYKIEKDKPDFDGNLRDQFRFTIDLGDVETGEVNEDGTPEVIHLTLPMWCNLPTDGATVSPKSNLWKLAVACGIDPETEGVDPDEMLHRPFIVDVQDKEKAAQTPGGKPSIYSKAAAIRAKREVKRRVNGAAAPRPTQRQTVPAAVAANAF